MADESALTQLDPTHAEGTGLLHHQYVSGIAHRQGMMASEVETCLGLGHRPGFGPSCCRRYIPIPIPGSEQRAVGKRY